MDNVQWVFSLQEENDRLQSINAEMLEALKKVVAQWDNTDPEEDWANTRLMVAFAMAKATNESVPEPDICPDCGSDLGHRVNCPRGIAFTRERE